MWRHILGGIIALFAITEASAYGVVEHGDLSGLYSALCRSPLLAKLILPILGGLCFFGFAAAGCVTYDRPGLGGAIVVGTVAIFISLAIVFVHATRCHEFADYRSEGFAKLSAGDQGSN